MPGTRAAHHREVERKFDVTEETPTPAFTGVAGVARVEQWPVQALEAVYFDTSAQDLARRKITLRRRTGGVDAGWHLKLPAGPDARTEVRLPLGGADDEVPAELAEMVRAVVRGRPLAPVARISTTRVVYLLHGDDGAVAAEFCDDHVTASTFQPGTGEQRWREWEIELRAADPDATLLDRLSGRLVDSGATPAGHGSKLARALGSPPADALADPDPLLQAVAEQVEQLPVIEHAVRADADDAVHQMRVTIRRIRSLLRAEPNWFTDSRAIDADLRWLAGVLGTARDAEVLAQRYRRALDRMAPQLVRGRVVERLVGGAEEAYRAGWAESVAAMDSPRYRQLLDRLETLAAESTAGDPGDRSPGTIRAAYRRVRKAAKATRVSGAGRDRARQDVALHRIRKAAKRLRYTASAMGAPSIAKQAKTIQTLLGEHQDSVVSREHLLAQARAAEEAGEDTFTYGLLYQQERDIARDCRAQLDQALDELAESMATFRGGRAGP